MAIGKTKAIVILLLLTGVLAAKAPETPNSEKQRPQRTDRYGDPLPPDAIARLGTIRWRHGDQVMAVAFSPDGKTLASGAEDKAVHLWDVKTGRRLRSFRGHDGEVSCVLFTPDGTRLVTSGWDRTTRLWSVASGKELRRWNMPGGSKATRVALSPDGKTLAGFGADKPQHAIYLWDVATGAKIREMPDGGKYNGLMALAFSPDGKTLLSGSYFELRRWNVATGKQLDLFGTDRGWINAIAFTPDGKTFAVGSEEAATLWDAATGKGIRQLLKDPVYSVAISPDGKRLATGSVTVRIWDIASGKEICACKSRHVGGAIWSVAFSPDGKTVAGGNGGSSILLWDAATGEERTPPAGHESWVRLTCFTPDGKSVLTIGSDGWVRRWNIAAAKETLAFRVNETAFIRPFALAPDGRTLAVGSNKAIRLLDLPTGKVLRRFAEHDSSITHLVFSPRGDRIASMLYGSSYLFLWDVKSGKQLYDTIAIERTFLPAFSPDGKILATGIVDDVRILRLWNADTGEPIRQWAAHEEIGWGWRSRGVIVVAFSADGKLLASTGADRAIRIWDTATGREIGRLYPDQPFICRCLVFAPDGKTLATAGEDHAVRLWETVSGKERRCFRGHSGWVSSVAYSADGRLLVSGSGDTSALVWAVWPAVPAREATALTPSEKDRLWLDLADADAARAWRAMGALHSSPHSALALLKVKLPPAARRDEKKIARLIAELDNDQFAVRSKAESELEKLEELAEPALRRALRQKPSLEQRRRLETLVQRLEGPITSADALRRLRAVEVLEHIGSLQAQQVLRTLAEEMPEARLTHEAKAALQRLMRRPKTAP